MRKVWVDLYALNGYMSTWRLKKERKKNSKVKGILGFTLSSNLSIYAERQI